MHGRPVSRGSVHQGRHFLLQSRGVPIPQVLVTPFAHTRGPSMEEMRETVRMQQLEAMQRREEGDRNKHRGGRLAKTMHAPHGGFGGSGTKTPNRTFLLSLRDEIHKERDARRRLAGEIKDLKRLSSELSSQLGGLRD